MQLHLQTRGRTTDYAFLGAPQPDKWWLHFSDFTSFEGPTILVIGNATGWRSYISGIPSQRCDRVGTQIRYTVVADGAFNESYEPIIKLIATWITDGDGLDKPPYSKVQVQFDRVFDEDYVERILAERSTAAHPEVEDKIRTVLDQLGGNPLPPPTGRSESWIGGLGDPQARQAFLQRVSEIMQGKRLGAALLLNMIQTTEHAQPLVEDYESVAVLLHDAAQLGPSIVSLEKKTSPSLIPVPVQKPKSCKQRAIFLGLGLLLLLILLAWLMLWDHFN